MSQKIIKTLRKHISKLENDLQMAERDHPDLNRRVDQLQNKTVLTAREQTKLTRLKQKRVQLKRDMEDIPVLIQKIESRISKYEPAVETKNETIEVSIAA